MLNDELTLIIVTYNSRDMIEKCLSGIEEGRFNIIVVDNASRDDTADFIAAKYPDVKLIRCPVNIGYGRGMNLGLRQVTTPFALAMNPDVLTSSAVIEQFLCAAKDNSSAALYAPRTRGDAKYGPEEEVKKVHWISGAVMLFDMKKFERIGFFDENIFLYYEETDLCKRVHDSGLGLVLFNNIYMDHLVGKSSAPNDKVEYMKYWHMAWSRFYFNKKHSSAAENFRKSVGYLLKFFIKLVVNVISGNKRKIIKYKASLAGAVAFVSGRAAFDASGDPRAKP